MPHSLSCMTVKGELKQVLSPPAGISSQIITPRAPATWKRFKQRDPLEFSSYSQSSIFFIEITLSRSSFQLMKYLREEQKNFPWCYSFPWLTFFSLPNHYFIIPWLFQLFHDHKGMNHFYYTNIKTAFQMLLCDSALDITSFIWLIIIFC